MLIAHQRRTTNIFIILRQSTKLRFRAIYHFVITLVIRYELVNWSVLFLRYYLSMKNVTEEIIQSACGTQNGWYIKLAKKNSYDTPGEIIRNFPMDD